MGDDDYHKKLGEMQMYVPFLETTIKRLKSEKDKPREAQISKLQSLLVILTDSKKKLKLDALRKCEEVILKLYDKVEKKPVDTIMHKYMCRTPPEDKSTHFETKPENDAAFLAARQKLKQAEITPTSPSPPLDTQLNINPVLIPTEKIPIHNQNPAMLPGSWSHYQTLNWPSNVFNPNAPQMGPYPLQNWTEQWPAPSIPKDPQDLHQQDLYQRRIDSTKKDENHIWDRNVPNFKTKPLDRELINYGDTSLESSPKTKTNIKIVGNNKEIIPIKTNTINTKTMNTKKNDTKQPIEIKTNLIKINLQSNVKPKTISRKNLPLPPAPQSRKSLEKEILPLNKPPLSDKDLQDLLSPVTESSSGGHSPIFNDDMDLEKLEEIKAKLCKQLEKEKPKHRKKGVKEKTKSPTPTQISAPVPPVLPLTPTPTITSASSSPSQVSNSKKPPKVVERVVKEQNNIFGSLLSSIDEQIMGKSKDKKVDKKDTKKDEQKKLPVKDNKDIQSKDKKDVPKKDSSKVLNVPTEESSDSLKSKSESTHTNYKSKESKDDKKTDLNKDESKDKPKSTKDIDSKRKLSIPKDISTPKDISSIVTIKEKSKSKEDFKLSASDKSKLLINHIDDKVFKTVEDIMKNLKESVKPAGDLLTKFGDLVKEKSDQLCDKTIDIPASGRLSDKYPHKRKSIESHVCDPPIIETSNVQKIPQEPVQPVKLTDPRLRNQKIPNLIASPIKELHFEKSEAPRNIETIRHIDFDNSRNNYNKTNADFSFQNSYNNINSNPNSFNNNNNRTIFCNDQPVVMRQQLIPSLIQIHPNNTPGSFQPSDDLFLSPGARTPGDPYLHSGGSRTPGDPFLNSGNRTPVDPYLNSGNRTPVDPFLNSGNRTPLDPFLNSGNRTPVDPYLQGPRTPGDSFLSPGNMTPADPFLNAARPPGPPNQFHNQFSNDQIPRNQFRNDNFPINCQEQFNPNHDRFNISVTPVPPPDRLINEGFMNEDRGGFMNEDHRFNNDDRGFNPNWNRPNTNQFSNIDRPESRLSDCSSDHQTRFNFQNLQNPQNRGFNQPEPNQYDLSQMNPIDFYDNTNTNNSNNNCFDTKFNQNSFRGGRGNNNRGSFGARGRGVPERDRSSYTWSKPNDSRDTRDPRSFRKTPLLPLPSKFSPNEEQHKDDSRRSRFSEDTTRDSRDHRTDRDYRSSRSRYNKDEDHRRESRSRSIDERHRFNKRDREESTRKSNLNREDHRRKSIDEDKSKEKEQIVEKQQQNDKHQIEKPINEIPVKTKEEIQSPLDSLYTTETKRIGKGYGLQSFKIPKIKKVEEIKEVKEDIKTNEDTKETTIDKSKEVKDEAKQNDVKQEILSPEKKEQVIEEIPSTSKQSEEIKEASKTEADLKLDMFNNFMKHIFDTCDSSVLFQYLDKCGFALPNAKTKRIRRIIDSDTSESEDEQKKEDSESDKPTPEPPHYAHLDLSEEMPDVSENPETNSEQAVASEPETDSTEKIVETVSERIKSRRRKPVVYSSDSSPEKLQIKAETSPKPEVSTKLELINTEDAKTINSEILPIEEVERVTQKPRIRSPKKKSVKNEKTQAKTRRKNALELLQEDIREMFISEGVLTATGKRMCRMMKEHQETGFIVDEEDTAATDDIKQQSDEEIPLMKRKEKKAIVQIVTSPAIQVKQIPKATRKSPRVLLEKIESMKSIDEPDEQSEEKEENEEVVEMKKPLGVPTRRTRRSNTISGEFLQLDENGQVVKVKEIKKKIINKQEDTSTEDNVSVNSDSSKIIEHVKVEIKEDIPKIIKKKKIRKRGRGGWATGVIKHKKKKQKNSDKNPPSPALTVSTNTEDQISLPDDSELDSFDRESNLEFVEIKEEINRTPKTRSVGENFDEEFSLLQIDSNEDVNYFLDNGNKFHCKLCDYKGKLIVHHYRSKHPESENMISRLSPEQASAAKIESKEFDFEKIVAYDEVTKGKKRRTTFICRFCLLTFKQEFTASFFDHICCHTGEYRYKCEKCPFSTGVKKTLSTHCHSLHPTIEKPLIIKPIYDCPPNFRLVFGYLCAACNFTQLLKSNLEKHIRVSHPNQNISVIKISMSTKPIPLTDLKPPEEESNIETLQKTIKELLESPKHRKQPKQPAAVKASVAIKKAIKATKPEPLEPEASPPKESNLTVFMVPEGISEQEKQIENDRLKKMEEIQSNVVPRRSKLQFVDKLKNKLDSVESEIALLESMEAENAANFAAECDGMNIVPNSIENPDDNWISIENTCSLTTTDQLDDGEKETNEPLEEPDLETHNNNNNNNNSSDENEPITPLSLSPTTLSSPNSKKSGVFDTIQRLAAQLQNNKPSSSLSDSEETERLYYSPEVTPESSPKRKKQTQNIETTEKLNSGSIEIQFTGTEHRYLCLIPGCYYTSNLKTCFRKHLSQEHQNIRVNCGLCTEETDYLEWDPYGLFLHMLDQHKHQTPVKKDFVEIKEEPVDHTETTETTAIETVKLEPVSPQKQSDSQQKGSIRIRRISGDMLSSFAAPDQPVEGNEIEYPTISIPEQPQCASISPLPELPIDEKDTNEPLGFLQISNVRTLTPEEENHLQIKASTSTSTSTSTSKDQPKILKKLAPKTYILNVGDLANSTKIVGNTGPAINLKRSTNKEGTTYNFTLNPNNIETTPALVTKTITSDSKPTKTIIFRKNPSFVPLESTGTTPVPKLALIKPNLTLMTSTGIQTLTKVATGTNLVTSAIPAAKPVLPSRKITLIAPTTSNIGNVLPTSTQAILPKPPVFIPPDKEIKNEFILGNKPMRQQSQLQPFKSLKLNKAEFIVSIMIQFPKILDFYKCPADSCVYSTNDRKKFKEHFINHKRVSPAPYCAYCTSVVAVSELITHLEKKHGNSTFQCAFCFYRAYTSTYITVHQSFCHQMDVPKFYSIKRDPNIMRIAEQPDDSVLPRNLTILPFYCTLDSCNRTFYTISDYTVHMRIFHKRNNLCSICKFQANNPEALIGHYVIHNIAIFQCRYCKFGSERPQMLLKHYASEHYNKNPIIYQREYKSGTMSAHPHDAARLEDIKEVNLATLIKANKFTIPPKPTVETQNHIPPAPSSFCETVTKTIDTQDVAAELDGATISDIIEPDKEDQSILDPTTGEIICNEPGLVKDSELITTSTDDQSKHNDTKENDTNENDTNENDTRENDTDSMKENEDFSEPEITLKHRNELSLKAIVDAVDPLTIDNPSEFILLSDVQQIDDQNYGDAELNGYELYICGTSDCNSKQLTLKDFKDHLYSCDVLTTDGGWYTCYHCKKRFKYVPALTEHLAVHGPQRYNCSLCPAKAHLESLIVKHMKIKHKMPFVKVIQIDKQDSNPSFLAGPVKPRTKPIKKSKKDDLQYEKELQQAINYTREQIEIMQTKSSSDTEAPSTPPTTKPEQEDKNSFGPDDIDKLPRPPIFAQEIKCKLCSYNTKVRSNILKHLKAHIENKPVADTAPVNPVPCLEKNELMFDKMTNLAASSHTGRMGPKPIEKVNYPAFIPASKRFVCGSEACNYLTHGDSMLRHHLTALHIDESSYKCPHCQIELAPNGLDGLAVDNILFHLKMHDLHLFKCNNCVFYHYQKHKIERHLVESHPNAPKLSYQTVRELDVSANLEETRSTPSTPEKSKSKSKSADSEANSQESVIAQPWRCGFCNFRTATRTGIQQHAASLHKIRSQFKCGMCEFRCSARNNYTTHFRNKHPNEKVVILSVYYKVTEEPISPSVSSSDVEANVNANFDTTPLWSKNKSGVKHIRGILLDDAPVAKRPKIIEKLTESIDEGTTSERKLKRTLKSTDVIHNLRFPGTFGQNKNRNYVCPTCDFQTRNSKQFVVHLYKEINYFRYICNFCTHKSTHMAEAQKHFNDVHSSENVVGNKQICTILRNYGKAEKWVEKCLQVQQQGIQNYETQLIKQEIANSSTETVVLEEETPELTTVTAEEQQEMTPEKPQLTPNRRSSRVATASKFYTDLDDRDPPVLEPEVPRLVEKPETPEQQKTPIKKQNFKCEHCSFVAKAIVNLEKHVKRHFEVKPYKCNLCSYAGAALTHLQSHYHFKHPTESLQYTLEPIPDVPQFRPLKRKHKTIDIDETATKITANIKCEPVFDETSTVTTFDSNAPVVPVPVPDSDLASVKLEVVDFLNFYVCFHCPRRSPSLEHIRTHFIEAHEKHYKNIFKYKKLTIDKRKKTKYSCQYCNWTGHPDGLKQHHLQMHIDKEYICLKDVLFKCEICTENFNKINLIRKHFERVHPKQNVIYQCITKENNDEYIETVEIFEELLEVKLELDPEINCEFCILSFTNFDQLKSHHELVHSHLELIKNNEKETSSTSSKDEMKKYKCPQCLHTSNSYPAMRDHLRNHNKPYKCGYCDLTASYPNILKTHHIKEHRNLEPSVLIISEAQRRNEELRDNLLHLQNGDYVKLKDNLKRHNYEVNLDEPPSKKIALDNKASKPRRKSTIISRIDPDELVLHESVKKMNVARKSTATAPRTSNVAKKSTTPRPPSNYQFEGFSFYGTKPLEFDEIKNIRSELPIMGKHVPLNIGAMSQILQLFPKLVLEDVGSKNT